MLTKLIGNETYYCPRPRYLLGKLDASLASEGLSLAPVHLHMGPRATVVVDDDGRFWLSAVLSPADLLSRLLDDPEWFATVLGERARAFDALVDALSPVVEELRRQPLPTLEHAAASLETLAGLQTTFLSYVLIASMDELVCESLRTLVAQWTDIHRANAYLFQVTTPVTGFRERIAGVGRLSERKTLQVPAEEALLCPGRVSAERWAAADMDSQLLSGFPDAILRGRGRDLQEFAILRAAVPILYKVGQEDLFIGKGLVIALSHCATAIGTHLVETDVLREADEILSLSIEEVLRCCGRPAKAREP